MKALKILKPSFIPSLAACVIFLLTTSQVFAQQPETPSSPQPEIQQPETEQQENQQPESQQPETQQPQTEQQPSVQVREDFSDKELKSFVKANEKLTVMQQESEQKMLKVIEDKGLTIDRFNELLESQRDPQKKTEATPQELNSFSNAAEEIMAENRKLEHEMTTSIEQEGIDIDTYKAIMIAYQQSPAVQGKINKIVGENN
jgi:hypothetical protein